MDRPLVSVITNSYNSGKYLRANIDSMLRQDYVDWEHIIVDCGSTDASIYILSELNHERLRVFQVPFCGVSAGRNIGIEKARGDLIAILDADDYALPNRLTEQVNILLALHNVVGVGSGIRIIDEATNKQKTTIYPSDPSQISLLLRAGFNPIPHSSFMFRLAAYNAIGGYSNVIEKAEDFDLLFRLTQIGDLFSIPKVLVQNTKHFDSHTYKHRPKGRDTFFYVALSLILNSTNSENERLTAKLVEEWLESIGSEGINRLQFDWPFRLILTNWRHIELKTFVFLLKMLIANMPNICKLPHASCQNHLKTPDDIALCLLSKTAIGTLETNDQNPLSSYTGI